MFYFRSQIIYVGLGCALAFTSGAGLSQEDATKRNPIQLPGLQSNGQTLLPNGWSLRPAGEQIDMGDFPARMELSPDLKFAAVLHSGWGTHEIRMVSLVDRKVTSTVVIDQTFQGLRFSEDGSKLFASGAEDECVYVYRHSDGYLALERKVQVVDPKEKFVVSGLAEIENGKKLLVCGMLASRIAFVDVESSMQLSAVELPGGSFPFDIAISPDKKSALVSLWGKSSVAVIDIETMKMKAQWSVRSHPTEMVFLDEGRHVLVGCSDDNSVVLLETDKGTTKEIIHTSLFETKKNGSTPNSLSITPDQGVLIVANADGHEWSMAAYATDFVERVWPLNYRRGKGKLGYTSEGGYEIAFPSSGYIWDNCKKSNVSYYSFGEFIQNGALGKPGTARVAALEGHFDPLYRSYDLDYLDVDRAKRFSEKMKEFEQQGNMPQFIVLRLPNDHTTGTRVGKKTPIAMVADNDLALGQIVETISKSKFWPESAIFVVEDDAQNGSDHVDAHRTVALAISPYIRRGTVDSTLYSTSSMLRSMELILGMEPMTQFDAAANPMYASFGKAADIKPFTHLPALVDLNATNTALAWGAIESETLNFANEDAADDLLLGDIVWRSVRGANSPMPPPIRAAYVFANNTEEDEEEDEDEEDEDQKKIRDEPKR